MSQVQDRAPLFGEGYKEEGESGFCFLKKYNIADIFSMILMTSALSKNLIKLTLLYCFIFFPFLLNLLFKIKLIST